MQDWKIAVMVIMCVVFVVGVTVLSFLIWRVSRTRTTHSHAAGALSRRHAGKHDHNLDSTNSSSSSCIVDDAQLVAVAQATPPATAAAVTGAAAATAHVLYFVDGDGVVRAVDLDALSHIRSGAALQHHMAALCGLERADTLALVCYEDGSDNNNNTMTTTAAAAAAAQCREVWVDLDALVARDAAFARRMWQTSQRPLVLSRLTEVVCRSAAHDGEAADDDDAGANTRSRPTGSRARHDNNTASGGGGLDVSLALPAAAAASSHQHQHHRHRAHSSSSSSRAARQHHGSAAVTSKTTTRHGHMDAHAALTPAPHASPSSASPPQPSSATSSSLTALVPPPMPVIVPTHTHITSNTPVCVSAAHYYTTQAMHGLTEDGYRLDSLTCATLETVMCNSSHAATTRASEQRVHVSHGRLRDCAFVVQPHSGTVSLQVPGMATAVPVVRRAADVVRYAVDAAGPSQWSLFVRPFCLPPGRWCVRAKSSTFDDVHYTTSAKVYTVDVA